MSRLFSDEESLVFKLVYFLTSIIYSIADYYFVSFLFDLYLGFILNSHSSFNDVRNFLSILTAKFSLVFTLRLSVEVFELTFSYDFFFEINILSSYPSIFNVELLFAKDKDRLTKTLFKLSFLDSCRVGLVIFSINFNLEASFSAAIFYFLTFSLRFFSSRYCLSCSSYGSFSALTFLTIAVKRLR